MYPLQARRNYKNFLDGFYKVAEEGALFRGSLANGLRVAALCASMTSIYDLVKENLYFFLGPSAINRFLGTAVAVTLGTAVSMPFDHVKTRLHTMRPLPNGVYPYANTVDCLVKVNLFDHVMCYYRSVDTSVILVRALIFKV